MRFRWSGEDSFTEVQLPELPRCVSRGACWADFDGDGFVDIFWPNKSRQTITNVEINRLVTIHFTASP
ncbi:MAG: VCBS repeat-containing protein [Planctomycetota bacterium]